VIVYNELGVIILEHVFLVVQLFSEKK